MNKKTFTKQEKKSILLKVTMDTNNRLEAHSYKTGLNKVSIINFAILEYLNKKE